MNKKKKKLLELPVCPHCGAVYRYAEIKKMKNISFCYHCHQKFQVRRARGRILLFLILWLLLSVMNLLLMFSAEDLKILGILIILDMMGIGAGFLILPYTVQFHALKMTKSEKKKKQENN